MRGKLARSAIVLGLVLGPATALAAGMPDPFAPGKARVLRTPKSSWRVDMGATVLLGTACACLGMAGLRRRWFRSRQHEWMAVKLAAAIKGGGVLQSGESKRVFKREACGSSAKISWTDPAGMRSVTGYCLDLSAGGAGVFCPEPPPAAQVSVELEGVRRQALVRHCEPCGTKFFVGLQFLKSGQAARA